eukprot:364397-Chlamydomonas_euryale.AAC.2
MQDRCQLVAGASGATFGLIGLFVADVLLNFESMILPWLRLGLAIALVAAATAMQVRRRTRLRVCTHATTRLRVCMHATTRPRQRPEARCMLACIPCHRAGAQRPAQPHSTLPLVHKVPHAPSTAKQGWRMARRGSTNMQGWKAARTLAWLTAATAGLLCSGLRYSDTWHTAQRMQALATSVCCGMRLSNPRRMAAAAAPRPSCAGGRRACGLQRLLRQPHRRRADRAFCGGALPPKPHGRRAQPLRRDG